MNDKTFEFHGTAGQYFVVFLISVITGYIPIFGWPIGFNYQFKWIAENTLINGRKIKYTASYGETLGFLLVNMLLLFVTLGIYLFWFVPKSYRFVASHCSYADETSAAPAPPVTAAPVAPPAVTPTQTLPPTGPTPNISG